jgi:hypothetical protein
VAARDSSAARQLDLALPLRKALANHQADASREQLTKALDLAANDDPPPRWAWEAHNLLAHAIGLKPEAVKHWEEFLRLGPRDSPYRAEAKASLDKLGHPWDGD